MKLTGSTSQNLIELPQIKDMFNELAEEIGKVKGRVEACRLKCDQDPYCIEHTIELKQQEYLLQGLIQSMNLISAYLKPIVITTKTI